ncbi:MAG: helix-turn-helix transcriptional regulator [Ruminococcaceae bacterium]|nr:helix-turn-helix transcriptional regulator [Oscillospiraceae bacterium]
MFKRIKNLREDKDWTQQEIADMLHISRSAYSAYENGANAVPIDVLIQLSQIHNTSIDYLLEQTDDPRPYERRKK